MPDAHEAQPQLQDLIEGWKQQPPGRTTLGRVFDVADRSRAEQLLRQWKSASAAEAVKWPAAQRVRVAIGGFSTLQYLAPFIECAALADGFVPEVTVGGYNQLFQDLATEGSPLLAPGVDVVWLWADLPSLLPASFQKHPATLATDDGWQAVDQAVNMLAAAIRAARQHTKALFVVNAFVPTRRSPLGIAEGTRPRGYDQAWHHANQRLAEALAAIDSVMLFPLDHHVRRAGLDHVADPRLQLLADCPFTPDFLFRVAGGLRPYVRALKGAVRKVLVLDLDGTLWGGVVGEDGWEGVRIGDDPVGKAFARFQDAILELYDRGAILAINSKNNPGDVEELFRNRPEMRLKLDHFAAVRMNWMDKVSNCRAIAEEINVGLDSLVFWDDNPAERALVRESVDDVYVVDVPSDPSKWADLLSDLTLFDALHIAAEDATRGKMYAEDRLRREAAVVATDMTAFLSALELKVKIARASDANIPRIASLLTRTNQFNLTTRRHSETTLREMVADGDWSVLCYSAEDRFGSYGIVGVTIVRRQPAHAEMDTVLLSCRALGKGVETSMLARVAEQTRHWGLNAIHATFIPTKKNAPIRDFLPGNGFQETARRDDGVDYVFDLTRGDLAVPSYVTIEDEALATR